MPLLGFIHTFKGIIVDSEMVTILQVWLSAHCLLLPDMPVWCDSHILLVVSHVWQGIRKIKVCIFTELKLSSLRSPFHGLVLPLLWQFPRKHKDQGKVMVIG